MPDSKRPLEGTQQPVWEVKLPLNNPLWVAYKPVVMDHIHSWLEETPDTVADPMQSAALVDLRRNFKIEDFQYDQIKIQQRESTIQQNKQLLNEKAQETYQQDFDNLQEDDQYKLLSDMNFESEIEKKLQGILQDKISAFLAKIHPNDDALKQSTINHMFSAAPQKFLVPTSELFNHLFKLKQIPFNGCYALSQDNAFQVNENSELVFSSNLHYHVMLDDYANGYFLNDAGEFITVNDENLPKDGANKPLIMTLTSTITYKPDPHNEGRVIPVPEMSLKSYTNALSKETFVGNAKQFVNGVARTIKGNTENRMGELQAYLRGNKEVPLDTKKLLSVVFKDTNQIIKALNEQYNQLNARVKQLEQKGRKNTDRYHDNVVKREALNSSLVYIQKAKGDFANTCLEALKKPGEQQVEKLNAAVRKLAKDIEHPIQKFIINNEDTKKQDNKFADFGKRIVNFVLTVSVIGMWAKAGLTMAARVLSGKSAMPKHNFLFEMQTRTGTRQVGFDAEEIAEGITKHRLYPDTTT